jgi:hypothetical protein
MFAVRPVYGQFPANARLAVIRANLEASSSQMLAERPVSENFLDKGRGAVMWRKPLRP